MSILSHNDTICALSTAAGGAMAIIRVSGKDAITLSDTLFRSPHGKPLTSARSHTAHYGEVVGKDGKVIDDVVALVFRAPRSYTGEDTVEFSCHGSRYIIGLMLQALIGNGARQALPGEFTQRAFLNGKLDLSQAEAVADLITSTNSATHAMAMSQLRGHFSHQLALLRDQLLHLTTLLELELDFSDQDVEFADRSELLSLAEETEQRIATLSHSFATGKALREGVAVTIIGKTNVGKSTLLNRLLNDDKAIVSDIHGTTRDVIEDTTQIHGVTFRFIDTAGLRETADAVERMGIERTYKKLNEAVIALWLTDQPPTEEDTLDVLHRTEGKKLIAVVNKTDLDNTSYNPLSHATDIEAANIPVIRISAKHGDGIPQLEEAIYSAADLPSVTANDIVVTNIRHYEALTAAHDDISRVVDGLHHGLSGDLLSEDLRACIDHLSEIVGGAINTEETLGNIFSHFCVGK